MTLDTRSPGPPSLHDNTVGAQEKMQCTELEASIQAMRWEAETWLQRGEKDNTGSPEWQTDTEGLSKEQLRPSISTRLVPLPSAAQHLRMGCWTIARFSYLVDCWQSRLTKLPGTPHFSTHKLRNASEKLLGNV